MSAITGVPRAADPPLGAQVLNQLFFQHSAGLNEQAAVNGFVGHAQASVLGILILQPSGNLLRRPVQNQFTRNDLLQLHVYGAGTTWAARPTPSLDYSLNFMAKKERML
jgi:hypothetical protein